MTPPTPTGRARPLGVAQRQDMIIGVVIPLIIEHGRDLTSRQIAESCGIAEGTIFRAFGDKETLITTAVERYLDPRALHAKLRAQRRRSIFIGAKDRSTTAMAYRLPGPLEPRRAGEAGLGGRGV